MTAGLVLAAGAGTRYGQPKALVEYDGALLVERAAATLQRAGLAPVAVVLGAAAEQVRRTAELDGCQVVDNPGWRSGMGASLRAGLDAVAGSATDAVVVLLVDTPGVTAEAVRRVAALAGPAALAAATYHGRRGHPVLLGREHWPGVRQLATGDTGARAYLAAHRAAVRLVACEDVADGRDLDVPAA